MNNPIMDQLKRQNPNALFDNMMRTNPKFASFVRENQGKTPEQIASEHGIDPSLLNTILKR